VWDAEWAFHAAASANEAGSRAVRPAQMVWQPQRGPLTASSAATAQPGGRRHGYGLFAATGWPHEWPWSTAAAPSIGGTILTHVNVDYRKGGAGDLHLQAEEQPTAIQHLLCKATGETPAAAQTPADFDLISYPGKVRGRTSFITLGTFLRVDWDLTLPARLPFASYFLGFQSFEHLWGCCEVEQGPTCGVNI
jgi:hypothetical protein